MIFSILTFITLYLSVCIKNRKGSLTAQSISCILESIYDFTINATTGAVTNFINFIRTIMFINKKRFGNLVYFLILIIFEGVIIFSCINTWAGVISLFPAVGSFIRTFCLWQSDMKLVRLSGITTAIFYGIYYIHYGSIFMICGYLLLFMTGIYSIWKNDIKNIELSKDNSKHIYQV